MEHPDLCLMCSFDFVIAFDLCPIWLFGGDVDDCSNDLSSGK